MSAGRKTLSLADVQGVYWSTERAEKDLLPLMLFKGGNTFGHYQGLWNLTQALKLAEVESLVDASRFVVENEDVTHAAGVHITAAPSSAKSIADKLWRLANRVHSSPVAKVSPETADYLRFLVAQGRGRRLLTLDPIDRWSPYSKQEWRRKAATRIVGPDVPVNPVWPFREVSEEIDGADLIRVVDMLIPKTLPRIVREDVCQDVVLAILEGEITADDLRDRYQDYIKGVFRKFPVKYGHMSLDSAPPWDPSGRTLAETLVAR